LWWCGWGDIRLTPFLRWRCGWGDSLLTPFFSTCFYIRLSYLRWGVIRIIIHFIVLLRLLLLTAIGRGK